MSEPSPRPPEHRSFLPLLSEHLLEYLREEPTLQLSQTQLLFPSTERALPEPQARRSQHSRQLQQPERQALPESLPSEKRLASEQQRLPIGTIGSSKSLDRGPSTH